MKWSINVDLVVLSDDVFEFLYILPNFLPRCFTSYEENKVHSLDNYDLSDNYALSISVKLCHFLLCIILSFCCLTHIFLLIVFFHLACYLFWFLV
jgi:hypothetical protein